MWAWIYEGALIVGGPIVNGCNPEQIWSAAQQFISGGGLGPGAMFNCWLDGWTVHIVQTGFTLQ